MTNPAELRQAKEAIRREMRTVLDSMDESERHVASDHACERTAGLDALHAASVTMLYMPIGKELDVTWLAIRCFELGKTVCVPRVDWKRKAMSPVEVISFDDRSMDVDEHGIRTPRAGRPIPVGMIDLIIVPGLAFDTAGNRLGRGAGYYDRFLPRLRPTTRKIGLGFDRQVVESIPVADHDVPMDMVVTDRRLAFGASQCTRR